MVTLENVYEHALTTNADTTLLVCGYKPLSSLIALRTTIAGHCQIWAHEELLLNSLGIDSDIINHDALRGLLKAGLVYMEDDKIRTTIESELEYLSGYSTESVMVIAANEMLGIGDKYRAIIYKAAMVIKDNSTPIFSVDGAIRALKYFDYHDDEVYTKFFRSVAYTKEEMLKMFDVLIKDKLRLPTPECWLECRNPFLAIDKVMEHNNISDEYTRAEGYRESIHQLSQTARLKEPKSNIHAINNDQFRQTAKLEDYIVGTVKDIPLLVVHPAQCIRDLNSKSKIIFNRGRKHGISSFIILSQIHYYSVIHNKHQPVCIDNTLMDTWGELYGDIISIENAIQDAIELIKVE